jgi:hypothetical protein
VSFDLQAKAMMETISRSLMAMEILSHSVLATLCAQLSINLDSHRYLHLMQPKLFR